MQIKNKHILTMLVVAGISAAALPANAATFVAGDLLLGFRATGGTGATDNLIVNLGQADTVYRSATSNIASVVDIGSLLTSTYGTGWDARSDLFWGIVGNASNDEFATAIDGDPGVTNYLTKKQSSLNPGTKSSTSPTAASSTARGNIANSITGLNGAFAAATDSVADGISAVVVGTTSANSWSAGIAGSNFSLGSAIDAASASGIDATGLDLYRILNTNTDAAPTGTVGTGSWEGTFKISSTGVVGFDVSPAAIPEPSRAMLAALGLGGLIFRRRRSQKA
jgi:MYXO-CTERM domain-containing protein